ncbi:hypothetical protein LTR70_009182 [Exophiala xenobiotica]|uniref:Uncharacterized protein n=1 Tax=Lithohypha guttulata TaxID=1690604 RepID=A0ABR0JYE2_9EURO|nr:hypothetical protein LTR24_008961 [Lithohypha guttulata]KAK5310855.1 hypothetical protein LTR70_009182 [Exophiala xenobiotica]
MAKPKTRRKSSDPAPKATSTVIPTAIDPALAALFASSAETAVESAVHTNGITSTDAAEEEASSDVESEAGSADEQESSSESESEIEIEEANERPCKRRKVDVDEDLESKSLDKLVREEEQEQKHRRKKDGKGPAEALDKSDEDDASDSDLNSELHDISDSEVEKAPKEDIVADGDDDEAPPKYEALSGTAHELEAEKTSRACSLGNVPTSVISPNAQRKPSSYTSARLLPENTMKRSNRYDSAVQHLYRMQVLSVPLMRRKSL